MYLKDLRENVKLFSKNVKDIISKSNICKEIILNI